MNARDALDVLREGNRRFVAQVRSAGAMLLKNRQLGNPEEQRPFAIVLGCSDSRAPAELVFDQGLGDLFVIRVAGNIVAPSQVGSVEFAAERFGTRLVVVMGHSRCGAVAAALEEITASGRASSPNIESIVGRIRPNVEPLIDQMRDPSPMALMAEAVRANVRASTQHLRRGSKVLETLIQERGLRVVGAEYRLETGEVEFFDGLPLDARG